MKSPILILHGWGKTGAAYSEIQKLFEKRGYSVFAPDLPGFGAEKMSKPVMDVDDYVAWVLAYLRRNKLKKVILIGHSFGGRIGAKLTAFDSELVEKLILTGAPLIRRPLTIKKKILVAVSSTGKKMFVYGPAPLTKAMRYVLYRVIGEWDYYKANTLRETLTNIVNEDLFPVLHKITRPTLLVWGGNEITVPVKDAEDIAKEIPHAKLMIVPDATHKLPYENPKAFADAVLDFL